MALSSENIDAGRPSRGRHFRHAAFAAAIVILVLIGVFGGISFYRVVDLYEEAASSHAILAEAEELQQALTDAEATARGFIITGAEAYIGPYRAASRQATDSLRHLRDLTATRPEYREQLARLEALVPERLELARDRISVRRTDGFGAAANREALDRGKLVMDEIRGAAIHIKAEEHVALDAKEDRLRDEARRMAVVSGSGLIAVAAWLYFIFYLVNREVGRRRAAERRASELNDSLERRITERTAELASANDRLQAEIGERERIADDLRQSTEMFKELIAASPNAVIALDIDRTVRIWNRGAEEIFGYTADEVIGQPYPLVPEEHREEFDRYFEEVIGGRRVHGIEVIRQHKDGRPIDIRFSGAPIRGADGQPGGAVYSLDDVTQDKVVARQLEHAQRMEAVGQLTGGVAHDFNNILAVVIGNLDLLQDQVELDGDAREMVDFAFSGAMKGAELTRQLLAFSRQQTLEAKTIDLNSLVQGMTKLLGRTLGEQIEVSLHLAEELRPVVADPAQVESALANLAINARDAMPAGGKLTIETANAHLDEAYAAENAEVAAGDYAMLAVSDTGTGIPPEIINRVFEPFFTTKELGKGTGLGLSMIYGFAKQSGGHLKVYSEPGYGTTVKLYLPRQAAGEAVAEDDRASLTIDSVAGATILVVEDRDDVRRTVTRQLEELGYKVVAVGNAGSALTALEENPDISLVFTDVVLSGGMTGYELAQVVGERWPGIRMLYTSGFAPEAARASARHMAGDFLAKPYRKRDLAEKVAKSLCST